MIANQNTGTKTLTFIERILRVAVGSAFIGSIFATSDTVLLWQVMLPLLGSYAVVSGITGISIVRSFLDEQPALYRGFQLVLSAVLVGTVFFVKTSPLGLLVLLPMVGIYNALAAVLGQSPVNALIEATRVIPHIVPPAGVLKEARVEADVQKARRRNAAKWSRVA